MSTQEAAEIPIPPVEQVPIESLKVDGQNPNRMTATQTESLTESIKRYGFLIPIVTNKDTVIADGEQRWGVAKSLGMKTVPIIRLPVQDVDRRLLRQILNKLRGQHVLNQDVEEFQRIMDAGRRDDLKVLLGIEDKELRALMLRDILFSQNSQNFVPDPPQETDIKPGDTFTLGEHKLMCGDCTHAEDVKKLLEKETVDSLQTDPPYGVYDEKWHSLRRRQIAGSASTFKDLNPVDYMKFTESWLTITPMSDQNTFYVWINQKNMVHLLLGLEHCGFTTAKALVWVKQAGVLTNMDYLSRHELCMYGWKGRHKFYGKKREDTFFVNRPVRSPSHPTMKPVELIQPLIEDGSNKGANIYDPFAGSGTTLVAAEKANRRCFLMEKEPVFCDVIIRRYNYIRERTPPPEQTPTK